MTYFSIEIKRYEPSIAAWREVVPQGVQYHSPADGMSQLPTRVSLR